MDSLSFSHNATSVMYLKYLWPDNGFLICFKILCCFNDYSFIEHLQKVSMGLPSLFFFKIVLTLTAFALPHNFRVRLSNSMKNPTNFNLVLKKFQLQK